MLSESNYTKISKVLGDTDAYLIYKRWIFVEGIGLNQALFDYFFLDIDTVKQKKQDLIIFMVTMTVLWIILAISFFNMDKGVIRFCVLLISIWVGSLVSTSWDKQKLLEDIMDDLLKNKEDSVYDNVLAQNLQTVQPLVEKNVDMASMVQIADSIKIIGLKLDALSGIDWQNEFGGRYESKSFYVKGKDGLLRFNNLIILDIFFFEDRVCFVESNLNVMFNSISIASKEWRYDHIAGINQDEKKFVIKNVSGDNISLDLDNQNLKALLVTENSNSFLALKRIIREKSSSKI